MKSRVKLPISLLNQSENRAKLLFFILLFCIATLIAGCTPVKPWQKGNLSKRHMQLDPNPMQSRFNRHIENSREGSSGGYGVGGGGCGCG